MLMRCKEQGGITASGTQILPLVHMCTEPQWLLLWRHAMVALHSIVKEVAWHTVGDGVYGRKSTGGISVRVRSGAETDGMDCTMLRWLGALFQMMRTTRWIQHMHGARPAHSGCTSC